MFNLVIGILGILLSISFGVYTIYNAKKSRKKIGLIFEKKECYSLFRDEVARLNIEINYCEKPINNSLILLKATIRNNGQLDIDNSNIYKPVILISEERFIWLESNIISQPNGSNVSLERLNDNQLQIKWDLLKKKEFIEFESLIDAKELNPTEEKALEFYNSLKFDFRITNLNIIEKEKEIPKKVKSLNRSLKSNNRLLFMTIVGTILIFSSLVLKKNFALLPDTKIISYKVISKNDTLYTTITGKSPNLVVMNQLKPKAKEKIEISEFNEEYKIVGIDDIKSKTVDVVMGSIMGGIYFLMSIALILLRTRIKKKIKATNKRVSG